MVAVASSHPLSSAAHRATNTCATMSIVNVISTRYVMSVKDKRTSNAMIAKALAAGRWTAKPGRGHAVAILLPDACEPVAGSADIGLDPFDVRAALAGGTLLDSEVAEAGRHMAVRAPRLAAYIKGLDDDGFSTGRRYRARRERRSRSWWLGWPPG